MKRGFDMKKTKLTLISFTLLVFSLTSFGQRREVKPVEFKKVSDRLFEIIGGRGAQGGMYVGDDGVLVIDAKMDKGSVEQVIKGIKQITDKPIKYLVNTHSDGDHVTGNRYFPEGVTFVAHENCRREFFHTKRDGTASEWSKPELAPFLPSITFRDKMDIYLGSKNVELRYFGVGHTTGDIVVYFPEEKTAFLGDQIFLTRTQLIHSYKGGNSFEHVKTLNKMLETLDADQFCSAHSEMTDRKTIRNKIHQMQERQEKVRTLISGGKNLEEIKNEFEEEEGRLVEAIYKEVKAQQAEKPSIRTLITPKNLSRIVGMQWILEKMIIDGKEYQLAKEKPFIRFDKDGKVTGFGSVNRFFGSMQIDDKGNIEWQKAFGSTKMAGPPEFMKQETVFLNVLPKTELLSFEGIRLYASTKDGNTELVFYVPVQ
jgi:glyoxylase-like metal-dependent hydrolase (beta-lactamase superfamily II)